MNNPEFMNEYDKSRMRFLYNGGCLNQLPYKHINEVIKGSFAVIQVLD